MQVTAFLMVNSMKKAMSSKHKRRKGRDVQDLEVGAEAVKVLRTVGDHEAFYFYEAVGKPTGETARNLNDFLDKVKSVKSESLTFHLQRGDFQSWVEKILCDSKLAGELGRISPSNSDDIRLRICETVESRIRELGESSTAILVDENPVVVLASS